MSVALQIFSFCINLNLMQVLQSPSHVLIHSFKIVQAGFYPTISQRLTLITSFYDKPFFVWSSDDHFILCWYWTKIKVLVQWVIKYNLNVGLYSEKGMKNTHLLCNNWVFLVVLQHKPVPAGLLVSTLSIILICLCVPMMDETFCITHP